jgi:xanthine dehydrogenase YagR molybdenum-binding subunit
VMQDDSIHWNGEPIAVVLADTQEQADHAASLVHATDDADPTRSFEEARATAACPRSSWASRPSCGSETPRRSSPPPATRSTFRFSTPRQHHNAIEPHAVTVAWEGDDLRVHDASQAVSGSAWTIARCFGIEEHQVHVSSPYVGGGFGGKMLWSHHLLAAAAARLPDVRCG